MSKTIVVTGNSLKTIFSYYLGTQLAKDNKKVIIISTDHNAPTCKLLMPDSKDASEKSLGEILSNVIIDKNAVMDNTVMAPKNDNLGVISYSPFKMATNYQDLTTSNIDDLFRVINTLVDYIIVDTQTSFNAIDKHILVKSDSTLCITTADYKGLSYRQEVKIDNAIHILSCNNPFNPVEDILHTFNRPVKYILPVIKDLQPIYNGVSITDIKAPKKMLQIINKLVKDVILVE